MEKGPLNSLITKDKGKATITTIKYSVPDRAMLYSFYNHSQPLWVWADRINISPKKLNLHVDVGGRVKASIKRRGKQSKERERPRTRASHAMPRRKSSWAHAVHPCAITMNIITNHYPVIKT